MDNEVPEDLLRFVHGETDPARFPHCEHVRMGYEMLRRHSFPETVLLFSEALRGLAARAGKPQAFHQTITIAFLSLIAERIESADSVNFDAFALRNSDLFDKTVLSRWYRPERLASPQARRTFLLPERTR
jgi:hypothetical protein